MIEREQQTPFNEELVPSEFKSNTTRLLELKNNPNKIVRASGISHTGDSSPKEIEKAINRFNKCKELLEELAANYSIAVPKFDFVTGKDELGTDKMFTITDRIEGENLENKIESGKFTPEEIQQLEELYINLANYLFDKIQKGGDYLRDVHKNFQFVLGHKKGEEQNRIYLVDIDPEIHSVDRNDTAKMKWMNHVLGKFARNIVNAENDLNLKFERVRQLFKDNGFEDLFEPVQF